MVVVVVGLRTDGQTMQSLTGTLERLCNKEERTWVERKFNQMRPDEVNIVQRNRVCAWLRKVAASMHFGCDTYALSVDLLDRFLATLKVRPKFLECVAVGCLYIAAKVKEEDDLIPITPEFVIDCNAHCSANELLRMERLILDKFNWYADYSTSLDFMQTYFALLVEILGWSPQECDCSLVDKYVELELKLVSCLQHHRLAAFKPRILALALISLELELKQQETQTGIDWLASISYLQRLAKVESDSLLACRDLIVRLLPSYKVVRLELADLAFISRAFNPANTLKNQLTIPTQSPLQQQGSYNRPTYADVVSGRWPAASSSASAH